MSKEICDFGFAICDLEYLLTLIPGTARSQNFLGRCKNTSRMELHPKSQIANLKSKIP
jgi:hypothetical protein